MEKQLICLSLLITALSLPGCGKTTTTPSGGGSGSDNPPIVVVETSAETLAKKVEGTVASLKIGNFTVDEINAGKLLKNDGNGHVYEKIREDEKYYFAEGSSWFVVVNNGTDWEKSVAETHPSFDVLENATVEAFNDSRAKINNGTASYYAYYDVDKFVIASVSDITNTYEIYDIGKTSVNIPRYVVPKTKDEKIAEFETKLEKLKTPNFTVIETTNNQTHTYLVTANGVKADNDYYTIEEGTGYRYYFDAEENAWYREEGTLKKGFNYSNITVTDLNENTNEYAVSIDGIAFTAYVDGDALAFYNSEGSWLYSDFGTTVVETPTNWQEKIPVESNLIVENGVYNVKLMKQVLTNWIAGDNQFGKSVVLAKLRNGIDLDEIKLVNVNNEGLSVYLTTESSNGAHFRRLYFTNSAINQTIINGTITTTAEMLEALKSVQGTEISFEEMLKIDETSAQSDVTARAASLLTKVGSDANAVFAYETASEMVNFNQTTSFRIVLYTTNNHLQEYSIGVDGENGKENMLQGKNYKATLQDDVPCIDNMQLYGAQATIEVVDDMSKQNIGFFHQKQGVRKIN